MNKKKPSPSIRQQWRSPSSKVKKAKALVANPKFLYIIVQKLGERITGEKRLRSIVFLAGVTAQLQEKASVLVKGSTSSGKSTIVKEVLRIFPPKWIVERAGLSSKALAYGRGSLGGKIFFLSEYRSAKEAKFLLRLTQSEGYINHEATTVRGGQRGTRTVRREGTPVVISTTTSNKVFADDETRYLSCFITETSEQTLAILKAQARGKRSLDLDDLEVFRTAVSMLKPRKGDFKNPPAFLDYVVEHLPLDEVRLRRDWQRFMAFLSAVALCRPHSSGRWTDITFPDYCVAYIIFEKVLVASVQELPGSELQVRRAIAKLNKKKGRAVTIRELAKYLRWEESFAYKRVKKAVENRMVEYKSGTREKNVKLLLARDEATTRFLPHPEEVFKNRPEIGKKVLYIHPFTGELKVIRR